MSFGVLEGVIAAETILSHVDGEAGRLVVRGKDIETWAETTGFDTFAPQIWDGLIDGPHLPRDMSATFGGARVAGGGEDEYWRWLVLLRERFEQGEAVASGHHQVE